MGRWSRHPMGSDGALDAEDEFFGEFMSKIEKDSDDEDPCLCDQSFEDIQKYVNSLTIKDLRRIVRNSKLLKYDRFVIPYIYQGYRVNPEDEEIKKFLLECFNYHDDITGAFNYCSETDENGEILELKHLRIFKENFDDVLSGKFDLPEDAGLFDEMMNSEGEGLINKL